MMTLSNVLDVEDLPRSIRQAESWKGAAGSSQPNADTSGSFEEHERELLTDALERAGGNQSEAARILRISRDRMRYKMAKYNLR